MIRDYTNIAANERTFLAWVRTGIAVIALGFVIERFNLFLLTIAGAVTVDADTTAPPSFGTSGGPLRRRGAHRRRRHADRDFDDPFYSYRTIARARRALYGARDERQPVFPRRAAAHDRRVQRLSRDRVSFTSMSRRRGKRSFVRGATRRELTPAEAADAQARQNNAGLAETVGFEPTIGFPL